MLEESASGEITHQVLIDRRVAKIEVGQLLGQRQPGDADLVFD